MLCTNISYCVSLLHTCYKTRKTKYFTFSAHKTYVQPEHFIPHALDLSNNKIFYESKNFFHKMMSNFVVESKTSISVKYTDVYTFRYRIRIQVPVVTHRNLVAAPKGSLY